MVCPNEEFLAIEVTPKIFVAQIRANISASEAEWHCSSLFIWRLVCAVGLSTPSCTWDEMATTATLEASVVRMKGSSKFGRASTGVVLRLFFISSKASC
jgi:hypothetical protein